MAGPVVRTRFAPSPTGELHLGNARTAVLNWVVARHHGGAFVLRLEDTDTARNVSGGEQLILNALDWLGLDRDEGPDAGGPLGPYRQSERSGIYARRAHELLAGGDAFRCFCSTEQLERVRAAAIASGEPPGLDRRCRDVDPVLAEERSAREPSTIRLRVDPGAVIFHDRLKGDLSIDGSDLGDMVLLRADGRSTYNLAVTVDDLEMRISHVIRGIGHLSNTPKQVLLYRAFGADPPEFIHIPTVLAPGGGKLSKREGAPGVLTYRALGYHPAGVVNYLSLLSWSTDSGEEFLPLEALIERIDLDRLGATDTELDPEKMKWFSRRHSEHEAPERLAQRWEEFADSDALGLDRDDLVRSAEVFAHRAPLFTDAAAELASIFREPDASDPDVAAALSGAQAIRALELATGVWESSAWRPAALKPALLASARESGIAGRDLYQPVRAALTGSLHGPDLADVAYALGRRRTLERLERGLATARQAPIPAEDE